MKVTIQDIAEAANVAKSTVSKVINNSPRISTETRQRVLEIMKQMNYIPSSIATRLAKQSSFNIGLLIDMSKESEFMNHFFYNIIAGIESVLGTMNYELTISNVQSSAPGAKVLERLVLNKRVDGLIMNNSVLTEEMAHQLNELRFPYISLGEFMPPVSWVDFDNELGGQMLTEHLLESGYSNIAFVGGELEEKLFTNRHNGYKRALLKAGMTTSSEWILRGPAIETEGYQLGKRLLQHNNRPDAIVCMSNYTALGVLKAAQELNIHVPKQLGIVAFDDYPLSPFTTPPLTCLNIDTFELGVAAGHLLMDRIQFPSVPYKNSLLVPKLIVRDSSQRQL
ncbi:MAG: LacI family DNA-binding transcriptional regulator [Candidatus Pristimantibacillus sp.]